MVRSKNGPYEVVCSDCYFDYAGREAYCRRKGCRHAERTGHSVTVGLGVIND